MNGDASVSLRVRDIRREAARRLGGKNHLTLSLVSLLFCLLVTFTAVSLWEFVGLMLDRFDLNALSNGAFLLVEVAYYTFFGVMFLMLVTPAYWGRMRMLGLMWREGEDPPAPREMFYCYASAYRLAHAWRVTLLVILTAGVPLLLVTGAAFGAVTFALYTAFTFDTGVSVALSCLAFLLVAAFAAAVLFLWGIWGLAPVIAIGNEDLTVRQTLCAARRASRGHLFAVFRFSLLSLLLFLLSLLTLGVLYLFYTSHSFILTYSRLTMTLTSEGEKQ